MPSPFDRNKVRKYLQDFTLQSLFICELGWEHGGVDAEVSVAGETFALQAIAHKRGMVAYQCIAETENTFPDYPTRQKIEKAVAKIVHEHIIVYVSHDRNRHYWQWVKRQPGHPGRTRQHTYRSGQAGEALIQKLEQIAFTFEEEEKLTLVDVSGRVRAAFDVEKVTRKFYDRFKKEHDVFLRFIEGIENVADRAWYASLMLNRMMFIYFIQKRGFLDSDPHYLSNRLQRMQTEQGRDRFQTFYRLFLLRLFHEGLGQPETDRSPELVELLGQVPYLNGGLFDVHDLERDNPQIHIPDMAFATIFDFFDAYQWHLDDRPLRNDNEINPDVLGYIFEKYINQKQMGAYYTKEDITGYISRNTVIPFLFDQAGKHCPIAFQPGGGVWRLLSGDPDRYFYEAVRHGISYDIHTNEELADRRELPPEIAAGLHDVSKRSGWNKAASRDFALPTETWREHVSRRQHYETVHDRLSAGVVSSINELITYNLDVEQFARDVVTLSEGPELVRAFWKTLNTVSILDPTCGSGAFLFAALNILEPLYFACLAAMRGFLDDLERSGRKHHPEKLNDFRKVLQQVDAHSSESYFILKSIIVDNLYGVDIMAEAVEICKLRLFLKLVAQLESYEQIEPLPDVDFNVRAGNTLVGFTSLEKIREALTITSDGQRRILYPEDEAELRRLEEDAEIADRAFHRFREMQTGHDMDASEFSVAKLELRKRLDGLREELNRYLAREYGVESTDKIAYKQWRDSHQPFHWFVEFYGIMSSGGFDVIIGNPPYVATGKIRKSYSVRNMETEGCPDVYAWILERTANLLSDKGRSGKIVPLSLGFSSQFDVCRKFLFRHYEQNWFSSFGRIPDALFSFNVRVRNTVHLGHRSADPRVSYSTRLHRWYKEARALLFDNIQYVRFQPKLWDHRVPKLNTQPLAQAFESALERGKTLELTLQRVTNHKLYFKQTAYNWLTVCRILPPCYEGMQQVPHSKVADLYFVDANTRELAMLLASGKLMLVFWLVIGDDFDVTRSNLANFPVDFASLPETTKKSLLSILPDLESAMSASIQYKVNAGLRVGTYNLAKCRHVTDLSDALFASAIGFDNVLEDIDLYYTQAIKTDFGK